MSSLQIPPQKQTKEILRDRRIIAFGLLVTAAFILFAIYFYPIRGPEVLLHVSYDASRELYEDLNQAFEKLHQSKDSPRILMNHAGSVRQVRNLAHGQVADVVSLSSAYDLIRILDSNLHPQEILRGDHSQIPFHSTVAVVVRSGNPKQIQDWKDLWNEDLRLSLPNPERSGAGRWAFLALYFEAFSSSQSSAQAMESLQSLFIRSEVIDEGSRDALKVFANRRQLDAFLTWESEALELETLNYQGLEAVFFTRSILAQPQVAVIMHYSDLHGTTLQAKEYLAFHFSPESQKIASIHRLRPANPPAVEPGLLEFPSTELYKIESVLPEGHEIWETVFGSGGVLHKLQTLRAARRGGGE